MEYANLIDTPVEWGVVGVIITMSAMLLITFLWWVRVARDDLKESQSQFVKHLTTTGERQTEVLVAATEATRSTTGALEKLSDLMDRHEQRAADRHQSVSDTLNRIEGKLDK